MALLYFTAIAPWHTANAAAAYMLDCRSAAKLSTKDYQGALVDAQASVAVNDRWAKASASKFYHRY